MPSDQAPTPQPDPAEVERQRAYLGLLPQAHAACVGMIEAIGGTDLNTFPAPKRAAFGLVARSASNLEAIDMLLKGGRIAEARAITRCVVENLVLMAAILTRPDLTMAALQSDYVRSRVVRADILMERSGDVLDPDQMDRLQAIASHLREHHPKSTYLNQKRLAEGTYADAALATYSQLSDDAAHATLASLGRHIVLQASGDTQLMPFPEASVTEACQTAATAANMTLGLLLGVRDLFGDALGGAHIASLNIAVREVRQRWPPRPDNLETRPRIRDS